MVAEVLHKKKLLAPELRFKDFQQDWIDTRLKDLTDLITKGTTPQSFSNEGINYVKIEGLVGVNINKEKCLYIDEKTHNKELRRSILQNNDLLFAIAGATIGKVAIVTEDILPANTNQALAIIRLKNIKNLNFVLQILQSRIMKKYIQESISVGAQPNLNLEQMGGFRFHIPTLPEQQKIASFLSSVDEKIQQLTRKKELLEQYKKGVMQQLFSGKLRFKDEDGKVFPKWEEKRLMDVVEPERKIRYGVVQPGEFAENGRLLVRGQDYSQGWANVNSLFRVSDEIEKKYSKARLKYQDLVITIVGAGTGFVAQVPIEFDDANITQTTARIAIDKTKGDPYYFLGYLRSSFGRKLIYSFIKGAAQPGLNVGDVEIFKVKVPCLTEQKKIANYLSSIDNKIESITKQITQTQTFKKGLLQQMFV